MMCLLLILKISFSSVNNSSNRNPIFKCSIYSESILDLVGEGIFLIFVVVLFVIGKNGKIYANNGFFIFDFVFLLHSIKSIVET